jgi:hypothetical protein
MVNPSNPYAVDCPQCPAKAGERCHKGRRKQYVAHPERYVAAVRAYEVESRARRGPCPYCCR